MTSIGKNSVINRLIKRVSLYQLKGDIMSVLYIEVTLCSECPSLEVPLH